MWVSEAILLSPNTRYGMCLKQVVLRVKMFMRRRKQNAPTRAGVGNENKRVTLRDVLESFCSLNLILFWESDLNTCKVSIYETRLNEAASRFLCSFDVYIFGLKIIGT